MGTTDLRMRVYSVLNLKGVHFLIINPAEIDPFCINKLLSESYVYWAVHHCDS